MREPSDARQTPAPVLPGVAAGDRRAVARCLERYGGLVYALAKRTLPPAEAEEAVQEIFVELWQLAARFDPTRGSEQAFVVTLARRRLIDRIRRRGRRPKEVRLVAEAEPHSQTSPDRGLAAQRAAEALTRLPDPRGRILQMALVEGWSHAEIADLLGLPLGTVKSHARRGLAQIRRELADVRPSKEGAEA